MQIQPAFILPQYLFRVNIPGYCVRDIMVTVAVTLWNSVLLNKDGTFYLHLVHKTKFLYLQKLTVYSLTQISKDYTKKFNP